MSKFLVYVERVSCYELDADDAEDAAARVLEGEGIETDQTTNGHWVYDESTHAFVHTEGDDCSVHDENADERTPERCREHQVQGCAACEEAEEAKLADPT